MLGLVLVSGVGCADRYNRLNQKQDAQIRKYITADFNGAQRALEQYLELADTLEQSGYPSDSERWPAEARLALMHAAAGRTDLCDRFLTLAAEHYSNSATSPPLTTAEMRTMMEKVDIETNPRWRRE